jgi:hypothetical protein
MMIWVFTVVASAGSVTILIAARVAPGSRVGRSVGGVRDSYLLFSPGRSVSESTLVRRVLRRMCERVTVGVAGSVLVPNVYEVMVAFTDFEKIAPIEGWFCDQLRLGLADVARRAGWSLEGDVVIAFVVDDRRPQGAPVVRAGYEPVRSALGEVAGGRAARGRLPGGVGVSAGDTTACADVPSTVEGDTDEATDGATEIAAVLVGADGTWTLRSGMEVGRGREASIVLGDKAISRRHCRFRLVDDRWCVEDLGSLNGTTRNGEAVKGRTELIDGDAIHLGPEVVLRFSSSGSRLPRRGHPDPPGRRP